jgi:hypothetical protein
MAVPFFNGETKTLAANYTDLRGLKKFARISDIVLVG